MATTEMTTFSVTVSSPTKAGLIEQVRQSLLMLQQTEEVEAVASTTKVDAAPKAKSKSEAKRIAEMQRPDDAEEADGEEETFEEEADEEDEPTHTLSSVTKAFAEYAKENTRDEALAILKKFKVKAVKDIPSDKYPAVMKALGH